MPVYKRIQGMMLRSAMLLAALLALGACSSDDSSESAMEKMEGAMKDAGDAASEMTSDAMDAVGEMADDAAEAASDAADATAEIDTEVRPDDSMRCVCGRSDGDADPGAPDVCVPWPKPVFRSLVIMQ